VPINCHAGWFSEQAAASPLPAPRTNSLSCCRKLNDAMISGVGDINVAAGADGNSRGSSKWSDCRLERVPPGADLRYARNPHERTCGYFRDVHLSILRDSDARRSGEV
jgi:hypothetical protein